jgi:serine/threonine-protein kinase
MTDTLPSTRLHAVRTPATRSGGTSGSLPPDILSQSCKRVGIAALVFAAMFTVAIVLNLLVVDDAAFPFPGYLVAGIGVVMSLAMTFVAGALHDRPELLLNIGLGFEVAVAFLAGLLRFWVVPASTDPTLATAGVSWIVVVILLYPSIAPNTPTKILIASLLAASMDPAGIAIAKLRGLDVSLSAMNHIQWFLPNYLAAILAVIPSKIIVSLSREVRSARELGSYRLEDVIGRGGMGEVHRATHRLLARPAAIKLIRPEILQSSGDVQSVVIERFKREARAAAELRSPHTIELYDFGVANDGTFYYVMELLDGLDLETLVEKYGPIPAERAVHLLRQTCLSLGEAHMHGLVHRDIKPGNIHTTRMGLSLDFVKVLDFGLVKALDSRQEIKLTAPDVATGTPAFMAPEVALGDEADARADIYSLGCVGYWLLTGQLVYESDSAVKMMYRHIEGDPVPPSSRTELPIPQELDALIMACLGKKPDDRPDDAREVIRMLDAVSLPQSWTEANASQWWERNYPHERSGEYCAPQILAPAFSAP